MHSDMPSFTSFLKGEFNYGMDVGILSLWINYL